MMRLVPSLIAVAALMGSLAPQSLAQDTITSQPGYFALDTEALFGDRKPQVEVSLPKALIQVALAATEETQPEVAELLRSIELVQVKVYDTEVPPPAEGEPTPVADPAVVSALDAITTGMKDTGWIEVMKVHEEEAVNGLVKIGDEGNILGLTLFVVDLPETMVFVNIVGDVPGKLLGSIMQQGMMGMPDMDVMNQFGALLQQANPGAPAAPPAPEPTPETEQPEPAESPAP